MEKFKVLWDEYRITKEIRDGMWWLVAEPDPPAWFIEHELGVKPS